MFELAIEPRFAETDALGHINNAVLPVWFEQARTPIFEMFVPGLSPKLWNLILARIEVEFVSELFYGKQVEIKSYIEHIGNSSFRVSQEAWQSGQLGAKGRATMVHYDHENKASQPIPDAIRSQLEKHFKEDQPAP